MQKWRRENGFTNSAVAIGYDAGERARITAAAARYCSSPEVDLTVELPWYPLIAWGIDREACQEINLRHFVIVGKSSCYVCPNMREAEWDELKIKHPDKYAIAEQIEDGAIKAGHADSARLFKGGYRQSGITCSCFLETDGDELPSGSWLTAG